MTAATDGVRVATAVASRSPGSTNHGQTVRDQRDYTGTEGVGETSFLTTI